MYDRHPIRQHDPESRFYRCRPGHLIVLIAICSLFATDAVLADWPTYRGNRQRTGFREQDLDGVSWHPAWIVKLPPPNPAWGAPARGSIWQNLERLEPRVTDDRGNVPLIVQNPQGSARILVASSGDDRLIALDPDRGTIVWQVETRGPVRFAPAILDSIACFGSDDGWIRAVDIATGKILWRREIGPGYKFIVGNNRIISPHPIRTSVIAVDSKFITHAGLFPGQGVYSVALDPATGAIVWRRKVTTSPQGYLLAAGNHRAFVPTGRSAPYAMDTSTGKKLYDLPSPGGSFCMLTEEAFFTGPGNSPQVDSFDAKNRAKMLSFQARQVVAGQGKAWTANGSKIACHDLLQIQQKKQALLWQVDNRLQNGLIVSGSRDRPVLLVGGTGVVQSLDAKTGQPISRLEFDRQFGSVIHLAVSQATNDSPPILIATTNQGAIIAWHGTQHPDAKNQLGSRPQETDLNPMGHQPGTLRSSETSKASALSLQADSALSSTMVKALQRLSSPRGFALVAGNDPKAAIDAIVENSDLSVLGIVDSAKLAGQLRSAYRKQNIYGRRVSIWSVPRDSAIPIESGLFNLVVDVDSGRNPEELASFGCQPDGLIVVGDRIRSVPYDPAGRGNWRHQYADAKNLADSGDQRVGNAAAFKLKWFGGVGPSRMPDRHLRGGAPLAAASSLVLQADGALIGVDPANGTERWIHQLPPNAMRYVTPYDGGYVSLAQDGSRVFLAAARAIQILEAGSGKIISTRKCDVPNRHWGYLAEGNGLIVTTMMNPQAPRLATDRKTQRTYVDLDYRSERPLVCSREILVLNSELKTVWKGDTSGVIPHGSIAVDFDNGKLVFLEARSNACRKHPTDRIPCKELFEEAYLVAVDLNSGNRIWEHQVKSPEAKNILYAQITPAGVLLTTSVSIGGKARYHLRMHDFASGKLKWKASHDHNKNGLYHGEQVHHPLVLGLSSGRSILISEPFFRDLETGKIIQPPGEKTDSGSRWSMKRPGHSCGTLSGSGNCLFFRATNPTVFNLNLEPPNRFLTLSPSRPGCWINMIPANGHLLIPEGSASCVCSFSLQTSLCFRPIPTDALEKEIIILPDIAPKATRVK